MERSEQTYHLGTLIKTLAQERGIQNRVLAAKLDVSESTLYTMFRRNDMSLSQLEKIAEILGVTREHLLYPDQHELMIQAKEVGYVADTSGAYQANNRRVRQLEMKIVEMEEQCQAMERTLTRFREMLTK